ncbi:hypothetical protein [Streptomyces sp. JW3]|uniref:hypothetical protein n=1 Tax=Streptomyces sp. JW3 TaxID=3456955 RepID=UPI003FA43FA5
MTSDLTPLLILGCGTALVAAGVCAGRAGWELAAARLDAVWRRPGPWRAGQAPGAGGSP